MGLIGSDFAEGLDVFTVQVFPVEFFEIGREDVEDLAALR